MVADVKMVGVIREKGQSIALYAEDPDKNRLYIGSIANISAGKKGILSIDRTLNLQSSFKEDVFVSIWLDDIEEK